MKTFLTIVLAAASVAALAAPETDAIEQKRVRAEKLLAAYGNACAQVRIYLKLDKDGEPPKHSFRYLCPNCNSCHSESAERYLKEGRPAETCAFAVAPDRFLVQDDRFRTEWVERIEVVFGGVAYPAKPVRRYLNEEALELRTERPVRGVTPLSFSKRIDFRTDSKGVFFFNAKENGLAVSGMRPNGAANFTHYADVGKDLAKATGNAIAVNASNEAVTVVFRNLLPVGKDEFRPPAEWVGESVEAIEKRWDDFENRAKASFVPLYLHLDDEENRKDGWSRRYSSYREDSESTDIDLVGILLPEGDVLAEVRLNASKMSEIDKIEAVLADGRRAPMEFVGAFAEQKLAVFRFADGKVPAGLAPVRLNTRAPVSRFLETVNALKVSNFSGKLKSELRPQKIVRFDTIRGGLQCPSVSGSFDYRNKGGAQVFLYEDGSFGGMKVEMRGGERYADDMEYVTAEKLAKLLSDRDFDPQFAIRKGKDRVRIAWIGVETQRLTDELAREKKAQALLSAAGSRGALVTRVMPGTPAAKAGLAEGDVLLTARLTTAHRKRALDDENSSNGFDWSEYFGAFEGGDEDMLGMMFDREYSPWPNVELGVNRVFTSFGIGRKVVVAYARDGERKEVELTLEQAPVHYQTAKRIKNKELGIKVSDMTFEVRGYFKLDDKAPGVVVVKVQPGNPAAIGGVRPLEIITHVNNEPVTSAKDFAKKVKGQKTLTFSVRRLAATRVVRIELKDRANSLPKSGENGIMRIEGKGDPSSE